MDYFDLVIRLHHNGVPYNSRNCHLMFNHKLLPNVSGEAGKSLLFNIFVVAIASFNLSGVHSLHTIRLSSARVLGSTWKYDAFFPSDFPY